MLKTLCRLGIGFFNSKQHSVISAATVIMITVFLSRILGLLRDRFLVSYFSKEDLGVYLAAFRLPNLLFELLIVGVLSTAFIPVFTSYLTQGKDEEGFTMATYIINLTSLVIGAIAIILIIAARPFSRLLAPGFTESEITSMTLFTRIILAGQVLPLVIGNFFTGMLQSYQRFIIPALAPVIYNVGILIGIIILSPHFGLLGPALGVVLGAFLFMVIQIPFVVRLGYQYRFSLSLQHSGLRKVVRLMVPRTFGLAVSQIDTTIDLILASLLGAGSVTTFYFAQHLQQLPIGLFGSTIAQAALPPLSAASAKEDTKTFGQLLLASYYQILFLVLPCSMLLFILRLPIVRLVFGAPRFDWSGTLETTQTLAFFTISLFAQSLIHLFVRAFYALHDTKTPVAVGMMSVAINSVLSVFFISILKWGVWSLALSTSIASIFNFLAVVVAIRWVVPLSLRGLLVPPTKMVVSSFAAGIAAYLPLKLFDQLVFDTSRVFELLLLTAISGSVGFAVYIFCAWLFNIEEVGTFLNLLRKVKKVPQLVFSSSEELVDGGETQPIA